MRIHNSKYSKLFLLLSLTLLITTTIHSQEKVSWNPELEELKFDLSQVSGVLSFKQKKRNYSTHHFSKIIHKPTSTLVSPDGSGFDHTGFLNFYRVLVAGGYLSNLRAVKPLVTPEEDGVTLAWSATNRLQANVIIRFIFREPNIIDIDMKVEALTNYSAFEIMLSAYHAPGFVSGAYVADKEFSRDPDYIITPEQIRITDQPMIHGVWPFFPRDEKGANLLTDGRHQNGGAYWRMAIGRRYGIPMAFFSKGDVDAVFMARPEDTYAVGVTYQGDEETDGIARHRSLYLSLFGEDLAKGEERRTQMRIVIGEFGSNPEKHAALYKDFLDKVK